MHALLWTLAVFGVINTVAMMACLFQGVLPEQTKTTRFIDAVISLILMIWAIVLLSKFGV